MIIKKYIKQMCSAIKAGFVTLVMISSAHAQQSNQGSVTEQLQALKKDVIALNRDLFILEEDLLFPASTQVAVYLSFDVGNYFELDAIELKINDETATHFLYTERQLKALKRGGVQRLFMGNLNSGEHELTVFMIGTGPKKEEYKRAASLKFVKDTDPKALEIKITDSTAKQQPEFEIVEI